MVLLLNEYRNGGNIHTDLYHIFSLGVNTNHPFHSSANTELPICLASRENDKEERNR